MIKKFFSYMLCLIMICVFTVTQAATREEIANIQVKENGKFKYWTKKSKPIDELTEYVKDVTNKKSKNFIPVEDRIVIFDCDGTLMCETAPYFAISMLYLHRALDDNIYTGTADERETAEKFKDGMYKRNISQELGKQVSNFYGKEFSGMRKDEFEKYVTNFINSTDVEGLSNLKIGESFYLPMAEIVSYLQANEFTVYIVSGADRDAVRAFVKDIFHVPANHVIGSDFEYKNVENQIERGQKLRDFNIRMNKVYAIAREIGKRPVLAFGNSRGDFEILNFTVKNNKYKSKGFMVLCDDTERELGNPDKAENMKSAAEENGWTTISMHDDFKTIYGNKVERTK